MNGGEQIAKILSNHGVRFIFTLCGGHISPILVGSKKHGIRVIDVRQEETAVFAADAVSRISGIPGVAAVTAGPGVTNTITALKNARMAQSPLILIGGAVATILKGRGALQDIDQLSLMKSIVKWSASIRQDCDIDPIFSKAFQVAQSGVPGPVFIECPIDLLYDQVLMKAWYEGMADPQLNSSGSITNRDMEHHLDHLYACHTEGQDDLEAEDSNNVAHPRVLPSPVENEFKITENQIEQAVKMVNDARCPVLLMGSQATSEPKQIPAMIEAVNKLNVPAYLSGMSRGLLGKSSPLQYRHKRSAALKESDLVICAGVPMDFRLNYGRSINPDANLISVNFSAEDIEKNRKPKIGVNADPAQFLIEMSRSAKLDSYTDKWSEWKKLLTARENERESEIFELSKQETEFINPLHLCKTIDDNLEDASLIVADGGDFVATASYITRPRSPLSWLDPGPFGTLGVGAGFALGAKLARPESDVWIILGDGAAGYGIIEFDTFVRHQVPVIGVIGNDAGWTQIARDQVAILNDDVATVLNRSNYHQVAEAFGGSGYLLKNAGEISSILKQAKADARKGVPVLINAYIGSTDFRKGSISM